MGTVSLQLYPAGLQARFDLRLVRLSSNARLAMQGISAVPLGTEIGGRDAGGVTYTIGSPLVVSDEMKSSATAWVVGSALAEAINTLALLCEESWRMCLVARAFKAGPVKTQEPVRLDLWSLADCLAGEQKARCIDKRGLSEKIAALKRKFGIELSWEEELDLLWRARNCFVHRSGVVGEEDADASGVLNLRFRVFQLYVTTPNGEELPLNPPMDLEDGGVVSIRFGVEKERGIRLGSSIVLSTTELDDLLMTVKPSGDALIRATANLVQECCGPDQSTCGETPESKDSAAGN